MWSFYKYKREVALIDDNEKVYYDDLIRYSKKISKKLTKRSLTLILVDNSLSSVIIYLSLIQKKIPIIVLNENISKNFLLKILKNYEPENICVSVKNSNKSIFKNYKFHFSFRDLCFLKNKAGDKFSVNNDICVLVSTSGSTGSLKLIKQTYKNLRANTYSIIDYLKLNKKSTTITTLPLSYTFGMSIINTHLKVGAKILVTKKTFFDKKFWNLFDENKIVTLYGVPYIFEILDKLKFFSKNQKFLKIIAQAGGKISETLQKKIGKYSNKYNKKFFIMYGQAEATTRISYLPYKKVLSKIGSIGLPIKNGQMNLIYENEKYNRSRKKSLIGEIVYQGKNVCMGYTNNKLDINKKDQWNGKIFTGDMARQDKDGYYYIVGRKKRFAKIYGKSLNLDEIENLLKSKFKNTDFAVITRLNKIQIYSSDSTIKKKILNFLIRNIDLNFKSFEIIILNKIPKLSNGKNNYQILLNNK